MTATESNPYVGPRPFERKEEDAARFFGRSRETDEIVSLIFGHPVILVYAQSGAGKTSLFNASIAPKLEENGFEVLPLTRVGGVVPKGLSLKEIANLYIFNALIKLDSDTDPQALLSASLCTDLEARPRTNDENGQPRPRVMIFDQFEELFTYTPEHWREQREGFFKQVVDALNADPLLRVVFVIREDFLAELDPYSRILPERLRTRYRLERLGENAALRAIKDPLVNTSRKFAEGVAETLVKELLAMKTVDATGKTAEIEGQYVEPVQLQVVCVTLWDSLDSDVTEIEKTHLKNFNVNDALSNFYRSAIEAAAKETGASEADLRKWFGKTLITPMGTRSTVFRGEHTTGSINNNVVDFLESRHIIRAEFRAGARWYELTHDRLVEPILASNRKWLSALSPLQQQAALWNDQGRQETWLFTGQALVEVEQWAQEHVELLTNVEKEFLEECRSHQKELDQKKELEAQQQKDKQRRIVTYILSGATLLMCITSIFAIVQLMQATRSRAEAEQQAAAAVTAQAAAEDSKEIAIASALEAKLQSQIALSNLLSSQSNALINTDFETAILLGIEAFRTADTLQSRGLLLNLAQANPHLKQYWNGYTTSVWAPNGKLVASGRDDGDIMLWDPKTGETIGTLEGHSAKVTSIAISSDNKMLASGSADRSVILWDIESRQQILQFTEFQSTVISVVFDPDNESIVSASEDGSIVLVNTENGSSLSTRHDSPLSSMDLSPNGRTIVAGSFDKTTVLWSFGTFQRIKSPLPEFSDYVTSVTFIPDENILVTGSCSERSRDTCTRGQMMLWDLNTGEPVGPPLNGHSGFITSIAFSPDGRIMASGSDDKTIILWDVQTGQAIGQPLIGHADTINSIAFSPDGEMLLSGSQDNVSILWETNGRSQIGQVYTGHTDAVLSVDFSPDGQTLASGSWDNSVILWNTKKHLELGSLSGHESAVSAVVYSPDGKILASASYDGTILLWDLGTNQIIHRMIGHESVVSSIVFSPDGETLASASYDQSIILWDVKTGNLISRINNAHSDSVTSITFSPDGRMIASGSYDKTVRLWDVETMQLVGQPLTGHTDEILSVAFSPDGKILASGSLDNTIILWDMQAIPTMQKVFAGHVNGITSINFSMDGKSLASGSLDNTIILWDIGTGQPIGQPLTGHTDTVTSVVFGPDNNTLASASYDRTVILWDIDLESLIIKSCQRAGRNFTQAEWDRYLPNEEYRITCAQWSSEAEPITAPVETQVTEQTVTVTATVTPEPTATATLQFVLATPTIFASPTIVAASSGPAFYKVVNVTEEDRLNIRAGPGVKYEIVGKIPKNGTGILKTGAGVQADNTFWYPITYNGISGWVNSYYLALESGSK